MYYLIIPIPEMKNLGAKSLSNLLQISQGIIIQTLVAWLQLGLLLALLPTHCP